MTPHTEAERAWWRDHADEIERQVGMGKMDAMACYTQMVQLLDGARRAQAAPTRQQIEDYLFRQDCVLIARSVAAKHRLAPARNPYTADVLKHAQTPKR